MLLPASFVRKYARACGRLKAQSLADRATLDVIDEEQKRAEARAQKMINFTSRSPLPRAC